MGGIGDVDDLVDVAVEALGQRGRVHVASPGVVVAVRAVTAGAVVAELPRVLGIGEVPDEKAFLVAHSRIGRRRPFLRDLLECRDHPPIGDLDLQGPGVGRTGNETQVTRVRGIGYIDDAPARLPEMRDVEEPTRAGIVQRHLEPGLAVEIEVSNSLDVQAPMLARRKSHALLPLLAWQLSEPRIAEQRSEFEAGACGSRLHPPALSLVNSPKAPLTITAGLLDYATPPWRSSARTGRRA